jgi:hypothetical protein
MYSYAGTDLHNSKHLGLLQQAVKSGAFNKLHQSEMMLNHLL